MKTDYIWVSEFGWQPTGITRDGRCHGKCESGSVHDATGRYRHDLVSLLLGPTGTNPLDKNVAQQRNAVPVELLTKILIAALKGITYKGIRKQSYTKARYTKARYTKTRYT